MAPPRRIHHVGRYVAIYRNGRADWEHRAIAERTLGKPLPPGAHVHHFNNQGRDNANRNLVICQDAGYHKLLHRRQRIVELGGNPNTEAWCGFCRALRPLADFWLRKTGKNIGAPTSQCRRCRPARYWNRKLALALGGYPLVGECPAVLNEDYSGPALEEQAEFIACP